MDWKLTGGTAWETRGHHGIRIVVHHHKDYDPDIWFLTTHHPDLFNMAELGMRDIEDAKKEALLRVRSRVEFLLDSLGGPCNFAGMEGAAWSKDDPRDTISKHRTIIISDGDRAVQAQVETNHGWHIDMSDTMGGRRWIGEDDGWPDGWLWSFLPKIETSGRKHDETTKEHHP